MPDRCNTAILGRNLSPGRVKGPFRVARSVRGMDRGIMKSRGENRAVWKGVSEMARSQPQISTGWPMTRGVVTGAPLGSYSTHSSCPAFSYTTAPRFLRLTLSPVCISLLSLFPCWSNENLLPVYYTHKLSRWISSGRESGSMQICIGIFSSWNGACALIERRKPLCSFAGVRVPVIRRLRDTGTDGSHCIWYTPRPAAILLSFESMGVYVHGSEGICPFRTVEETSFSGMLCTRE